MMMILGLHFIPEFFEKRGKIHEGHWFSYSKSMRTDHMVKKWVQSSRETRIRTTMNTFFDSSAK